MRIEALIGAKKGANQKRWQNAQKDQAFKLLLPQVIIETGGDFIKCLPNATIKRVVRSGKAR